MSQTRGDSAKMLEKNHQIGVRTLIVGPFAVNCYVLVAENRDVCALVDPGGDAELILAEIEKIGCRPEAILLTHGHIDHVLAVPDLCKALDAPVMIHRAEKSLLQNLPAQAEFLGLSFVPEFRVDRWLEEGQEIAFGGARLSVLWTPGHSPGSCAFVGRKEVFVGDTLFAGSIGRTDLPGGDAAKLRRSIREKLFQLPDFFTVYPGHGPSTTLAHEKATNPFVGKMTW